MDNEPKINIMIVDDHPIFRVGLKMSLRYSGVACAVVAEAENVMQATECLKARGNDLDLLMLDFFLPDGTAIDVIDAVKTYCPDVKVLLLSGEVLPEAVMRLVRGRIDGFIGKTVKSEEMKRRIETLFGRPSEQGEETGSDELTERELEVIRLCANGLTAREIGVKLHIGKRTVETHKERIFVKLDLKSTKELINYAFRNGLMD